MITVEIDTEELTRGLSEFAQDQMPFAMSWALNTAAFGVRTDVNRQLVDDFTVAPSKLAFLQGRTQVRGPDRATRNQLWARVGIYDQGRMGGGLVSRHVEGGRRTADAARPFYIPSKHLRPDDYALVNRGDYPRKLKPIDRTEGTGAPYANLSNTRRRRGRKAAPRPFVIQLPRLGPGVKGIFHRYGPARSQIALLWLYVPEVDLPARLDWEGAVARQLDAFPDHLRAGFERAFSTARVRR